MRDDNNELGSDGTAQKLNFILRKSQRDKDTSHGVIPAIFDLLIRNTLYATSQLLQYSCRLKSPPLFHRSPEPSFLEYPPKTNRNTPFGGILTRRAHISELGWSARHFSSKFETGGEIGFSCGHYMRGNPRHVPAIRNGQVRVIICCLSNRRGT
jgi:hypothetical protein